MTAPSPGPAPPAPPKPAPLATGRYHGQAGIYTFVEQIGRESPAPWWREAGTTTWLVSAFSPD